MRPLRVLFVAPYVPSRLRPRPLHFIQGLAERGHRVVLVAAATLPGELEAAEALRPLCEQVHAVRVPTLRSLWNSARALGRGLPMQAAYCSSALLTSHVRAALAAAPSCDVVHIEHLRAATYGLAAIGRPRVFDAVDCMSALHARAARLGPTWRSRLAAWTERAPTRRFEHTLLQRFDRVLVTSEQERRALLAIGDGAGTAPVTVLPNGVDLDHFAPQATPRDPDTLVFAGRMAYHANLAAARVLIDAIMPRVWARRPRAELVIAGADPPRRLRTWAARAGARVRLTGTVADLRPYLARAAVSVSPLPYAVGIQNKVLEAMAMAMPVVASPAAAAPLAARPGVDLLVEVEPDGFAAAVLRLIEDPLEAARIGAAGRAYVQEQHQWPLIAVRLEAVYREAIASAARSASGIPR